MENTFGCQCMWISFSMVRQPFSGCFDYEFWLLVSWEIVEQFKFAKLKAQWWMAKWKIEWVVGCSCLHTWPLMT